MSHSGWPLYTLRVPPSVPILCPHPSILSEPPLEVRCQWCGYFFCSLYCVRRIRVYRESQRYHHEHRETSWALGPGTLSQNQIKHESSRTISEDGYTGHDQGHALIEANNLFSIPDRLLCCSTTQEAVRYREPRQETY
jgi:hypothetical protein